MVAAARAIALGAAPQTDLRTVAIDLRRDWPKALVSTGFDESRPAAWIAEGLFGYLPPEAQDRLLDNISALSAAGSRLAVEAIPDRPQQDVEKARAMLRRATDKWRAHGFELDWEELGFEGERNDVAAYLKNLGWRTVGRQMSELLAGSGLAAIPQTNDSVSVADTIYYSSVLDR
nr:SAM-dependent methyltransferase [Mycobacterium sp. E1747]